MHRWVKNVTIKAERGCRLLGLSLNWRNQDSKDEAQECKTLHDSPPYCILLIAPSVLLDRACRLILLSKLSIDFDLFTGARLPQWGGLMTVGSQFTSGNAAIASAARNAIVAFSPPT